MSFRLSHQLSAVSHQLKNKDQDRDWGQVSGTEIWDRDLGQRIGTEISSV